MMLVVFKLKYLPTALINFDEIKTNRFLICFCTRQYILEGKAKRLKLHLIMLKHVNIQRDQASLIS